MSMIHNKILYNILKDMRAKIEVTPNYSLYETIETTTKIKNSM